MAGLLDIFSGNAGSDVAQSLLGFGSGLLQASGRPGVSSGQALASGVQGLQAAQDRMRDQQMLALQAKLLGFRVKDAESDFASQEQGRTDAKAARDWLQHNGGGGVADATAPARAVLGGNLSPITANAATLAAAPPPPQADPEDYFGQKMSMAKAMRASGNPILMAQAKDIEDQALKFRDEFSTDFRVAQGEDGKLHNYLVSKSGKIKDAGVGVRPEMVELDLGSSKRFIDKNSVAPGTSYAKSADPNAVLSASVSRENSLRTDARAREFNAISQESNAIKRAEKQREGDLAKSGQLASFDTMLSTLDRLKGHPGLSKSVGVYSKLPTMPGSDSANFQAEMETFKSQAFLPMVSQLKGMGALSDAEGKKLTAAIGALDPSMGEQAFKQSMDRIYSDMDSAKKRVVSSLRPELQQQFNKPADPKGPTLDAKPTANASNKGRTIVEHETGKRYRSNGLQWVEVK